MKRAALLPLVFVLASACGEEPQDTLDGSVVDLGGDAGVSDSGRPDAGEMDATTSSLAVGWTPESHSADGEPDYSMVFPDQAVGRLDIVIHPQHWAEMEADLDDVTSGGGGEAGQYFGRLTTACLDKNEGDTCSATLFSKERNGTCFNFGDDDLYCDVGFIETFACEEKSVGDTCRDIFSGSDGECVAEAAMLVCRGEGGFGNDDYAAADFWAGKKPQYVPCLLSSDGKTWPHVGIRYKGNNSLAQSGPFKKKPLRLKFDEFEDERPEIDNQRFYGFQHLSLGNNIVDTPYLRQRTAAALFARGGLPSPAVAFYRVHIDHGAGPEYWGLYTMTEVPDDPFLNRVFGHDEGNLYKPDGRGARFAEFVQASYHKKNNKRAADFSDIIAFITALNASPADRASWRTVLETSFDMASFIQFWVANQAMANWDTYGALAHNYYLYNDRGPLKFIPWDFDLSLDGTAMFQEAELDPEQLFFPPDEAWPLLTAIAEDPVYRMAYDEQLQIFLDTAFAATVIEDDVAAWHALIRPHVVGPEGEQSMIAPAPSESNFDDAHQRLQSHIAQRKMAVREYLNGR